GDAAAGDRAGEGRSAWQARGGGAAGGHGMGRRATAAVGGRESSRGHRAAHGRARLLMAASLASADLPDRVAPAVAAVRVRTDLTPHAAITLGSGLGAIADAPSPAVSIPTAEIPHWPHSTV